MRVRVLKWIGIVGPGLIAGLFETLRHGYFDDWMPTLYGNVATMALVIVASGLLLSQVFRVLNAREKALHAAETQNSIFNERERIARDLHDSMSQSIFYLNIKVRELEKFIDHDTSPKAVEEIEEIDDVLSRLYDDVRRTIFQLKAMEDSGDTKFIVALKQYLHEFEQRFGVTIQAHTVEHVCREDCPDAELELFRMIQEILINAWRHGEVRNVDLWLESGEEIDRLVVTDDGKGFDLAKVPGTEEGHFGLMAMRERAKKLGGRLDIDTAPGKGTTVTFLRDTTKGGSYAYHPRRLS